MKNVTARQGAADLSPLTSPLVEAADLLMTKSAPGAVRILGGPDVPAAALAEIEADWALVAAATRDAPDLVPELVRHGLDRLQRHALAVSGVAVAERLVNPFARWMPAARRRKPHPLKA